MLKLLKEQFCGASGKLLENSMQSRLIGEIFIHMLRMVILIVLYFCDYKSISRFHFKSLTESINNKLLEAYRDMFRLLFLCLHPSTIL